MALTVLLMATLWQRDIVSGFADMEKIKLQYLIEDIRANPKDILKNKKTAATGGMLINISGEETLLGIVNEHAPSLRAQAEQALYENNIRYAMDGFFWNIIIPAKAYMIISMPVDRQGENQGVIAMLYPLNKLYLQMGQHFRIIFPCLLVNMLVLLSIALFRFRRFLFLPLTKLINLTDTYHEERDAPFPTIARNNELGQLSSSLQKMLHRIEDDREKLCLSVTSLESANQELLATRTEMIRTEKLASVGRLAAGLAHEIGNPIGVILGYIGLLKNDNITARERAEFTGRAEKEIQRINKLIRQLLDFSRINNNHCIEQVSIHDILNNLMDMASTCRLDTAKINTTVELSARHDVVKGDPDQLQQVFLNCLLNSVDALIETSVEHSIKINTSTITNQKIQIIFKDSGTGIPPAHRHKIFDPFFTTKEPGKGTGLGLSVAFSIIEQHGGSIRVESSTGQGTSMIIELPLHQET